MVTEQRPTKKDFVDLINAVMGQKVMTEEQLTNFLNGAKQVRDKSGNEALLEYIQQATNAPVGKDQLRGLADEIKRTGDPVQALDYLQREKLLSESQRRKLNQSIDRTVKKKRKR